MGSGIELKCPKCSFHKEYYLGSGMLLPETYAEVVSTIKDCEYGSEWRDYFKTHAGAAVDVDKEVYHCPLCNAIVEDFNLDLYNTINGAPIIDDYFDPGVDHRGYKFVKHYAHLCPICDGPMEKTNKDTQKSLPCPRCGTTLIYSPSFIWD